MARTERRQWRNDQWFNRQWIDDSCRDSGCDHWDCTRRKRSDRRKARFEAKAALRRKPAEQ